MSVEPIEEGTEYGRAYRNLRLGRERPLSESSNLNQAIGLDKLTQ
jgi:hypothetical protein